MDHSPQTLINHISRLEGQLASIKKNLEQDVPDCERAAATLKATSRSFSSLRQAFVTCFLYKKYPPKLKDKTLDTLLSVINS